MRELIDHLIRFQRYSEALSLCNNSAEILLSDKNINNEILQMNLNIKWHICLCKLNFFKKSETKLSIAFTLFLENPKVFQENLINEKINLLWELSVSLYNSVRYDEAKNVLCLIFLRTPIDNIHH